MAVTFFAEISWSTCFWMPLRIAFAETVFKSECVRISSMIPAYSRSSSAVTVFMQRSAEKVLKG
jgi:hypothetical protein